MGGGGVDGAIHRAGGPEILTQCQQIVADIGQIDAGGAVITTAGQLPAKYVIHAVGPIWQDGKHFEDQHLASAYRQALELAAANGCATVAFPSISTGAYRFPVARAARVALRTVREFLADEEAAGGLEEVRFVLFSAGDLATYQQAWQELTA
jgi:O-acetyl-ADP-ribose deacetylase (regulator of RNase III)